MPRLGTPGVIDTRRDMTLVPLSKGSIQRHIRGLRGWINGEGDYEGTMRVFIVRLLVSDASWSDKVVLDLFHGAYGQPLQEEALYAIHILPVGGESNVNESFLMSCVRHGRLGLLSALADRGMPAWLAEDGGAALHLAATTQTGRWLDYLSSGSTGATSNTLRTSLPQRLLDLSDAATAVFGADKTLTLQTLAEILVRHDPSHQDVARLHANPAGAVAGAILTEAAMRARIQAQALGAGDDVSNTVPVVRRRSRHV